MLVKFPHFYPWPAWQGGPPDRDGTIAPSGQASFSIAAHPRLLMYGPSRHWRSGLRRGRGLM